MQRALWGYGAALLTIGALDALWLGLLARNFYRAEMGALMAEQVRLVPAAAFYLAYPVGVIALALWPMPPTLGAGVFRAALLGLIAYGVYDMTNLATLRGYSVQLALTDLAWGVFVSACGGAAGWVAMRRAGTR